MADAPDRAPDHASRRRHPRVFGPFEGKRDGLLPVPILVHDLSMGGSLIECFHEEAEGRRVTISLDLPNEGWVTLDAVILYTRPDYGYAVRWVDVPAETCAKLERVIGRLVMKSAADV